MVLSAIRHGFDLDLSFLSNGWVIGVVGAILISALALTLIGFPPVWRRRQRNMARHRQPRPGNGAPLG